MEPPSSNISVTNESGHRVDAASLQAAIAVALSLHGRRDATIDVLLATDERMAELNRMFRGVKGPTDVLAFPSDGFPNAPLGDIAIAVPYAERQALARGVDVSQELAFLGIHGALHLLGYDDETEPERAAMVDEMNRCAERAGLEPDREWASLLHEAKK